NGNYYSNHFAVDNPDPRLQDFLKKYRTTFNHDPDAIGGPAYDAANPLFQSLDKLAPQDPAAFKGPAPSQGGSPQRKEAEKKLRDIVASTANFAGVTGNITLDKDRNASKPAVVLAIKGGKKIYDTTVNP